MKYQLVTYKNAALNPPAASRTSTGDAMAANTNAVMIKRDERGRQQPPEPAGSRTARTGSTRPVQVPQQQPGDQKPRQHEEHVHARRSRPRTGHCPAWNNTTRYTATARNPSKYGRYPSPHPVAGGSGRPRRQRRTPQGATPPRRARRPRRVGGLRRSDARRTVARPPPHSGLNPARFSSQPPVRALHDTYGLDGVGIAPALCSPRRAHCRHRHRNKRLSRHRQRRLGVLCRLSHGIGGCCGSAHPSHMSQGHPSHRELRPSTLRPWPEWMCR